MSSDGFSIVHFSDLEQTGNWSLVRRTLGVSSFGVNMVEIEPGDQIPEHDESDRDQEELFYVVDGEPVLVIDGTEHPAPAGTFARLDPPLKRTVRNTGSDRARVLIISAPRGSGYEPMGWA